MANKTLFPRTGNGVGYFIDTEVTADGKYPVQGAGIAKVIPASETPLTGIGLAEYFGDKTAIWTSHKSVEISEDEENVIDTAEGDLYVGEFTLNPFPFTEKAPASCRLALVTPCASGDGEDNANVVSAKVESFTVGEADITVTIKVYATAAITEATLGFDFILVGTTK